MSIIQQLKEFFAPVSGEELIIDDEIIEEPAAVAEAEKKVVGGEPISVISSSRSASPENVRQGFKVIATDKAQEMRIQIYTPQNFDNVSDIADALKSKRSAIVNYERVEMTEQRRICDFLNGVCYVQDGEVRRITNTMVLYVPNGVMISEVRSVVPDAAPAQF